MLVDFSQLVQEFIGALGLRMEALCLLDEALRLTLSSTLLQHLSQSVLINILAQTIYQDSDPFLSASSHFSQLDAASVPFVILMIYAYPVVRT